MSAKLQNFYFQRGWVQCFIVLKEQEERERESLHENHEEQMKYSGTLG